MYVNASSSINVTLVSTMPHATVFVTGVILQQSVVPRRPEQHWIRYGLPRSHPLSALSHHTCKFSFVTHIYNTEPLVQWLAHWTPVWESGDRNLMSGTQEI